MMPRNVSICAALAGEALTGLADIFGLLRERRDHDLLVEAQNRYTQEMAGWDMEAERNRTGDRARGFTRDYAGQSDQTATATATATQEWLAENGGSPMAGRAFRQWSAGHKTAGGLEATRFEHWQMLAHSKDLFE
jgi:hypothetical protein